MIDRACISLNDTCNLRCKYCHFQEKQKGSSRFESDDLERILKNAHDYCTVHKLKCFTLGIVGAGEPLIEKINLEYILDYIYSNSYNEFKVYIITNGTLITIDFLEKMYAYRHFAKLCISLDGYQELHDLGRAHFSDVWQSILLYKTVFGKAPAINATVNRVSYENKERLVDFYLDNDIREVTFSKLFSHYFSDLSLSDAQFESFLNYADSRGLLSRQFSTLKKYDCTKYGCLCGVGRNNIFYTPEGVYPCGRFYKMKEYLLGSFSDPLDKIEHECSKITPVIDGYCYFDVHIGE